MKLPINQILCGDALEMLKTLPDESINCCISSPPYWALRDYGVEGQLGLEPTFEEYIDKLCNIYDEVKRVLRKDGTCWVNLGDTYSTVSGRMATDIKQPKETNHQSTHFKQPKTKLPEKSLCLIPQRFAIEMVNRGWILRNTIIWHKPNPMPSSAKDRFTVDFEYVYFFSKNKQYFFEPIYEEQTGNSHSKGSKLHPPIEDAGVGHKDWHKYTPEVELPLGRNKRTVWTIPTQPFPEAHFATYPEKLVEPMIEAGCPMYVCTKCGKPRKKVYEKGESIPTGHGPSKKWTEVIKDYRGEKSTETSCLATGDIPQKLFKGYSDCGCNAELKAGIVLDPFAGSGTTLHVAARMKRDFLGIELNPQYITEIAEYRVQKGLTGVTIQESKLGQGALFDSVDSVTSVPSDFGELSRVVAGK